MLSYLTEANSARILTAQSDGRLVSFGLTIHGIEAQANTGGLSRQKRSPVYVFTSVIVILIIESN